MINFKHRKLRKQLRHLGHEATHLRHMREDVAPHEKIEHLDQAIATVRQLSREPELTREQAGQGIETLQQAMGALSPARSFPRVRENVEIIAVALVVAMGFRTYFVQPFKIPTGSMQPTLYGITATPDTEPSWTDRFPFNLFRLAAAGERYITVRANTNGRVDNSWKQMDTYRQYFISGIPQKLINVEMAHYFMPGAQIEAGQVLATGHVRYGDHIFVDKVRYNFVRPDRGDIFVFDTAGIKSDAVKHDSFYIKRLAGLPGERIQIQPPYLIADGNRVTDPYPFTRMVTETNMGYVGYVLGRTDLQTTTLLGHESDVLTLASNQYLPLGDNTRSSLDGRYFGGVEESAVQGPAFFVYWPFIGRWGFTDHFSGSWILAVLIFAGIGMTRWLQHIARRVNQISSSC